MLVRRVCAPPSSAATTRPPAKMSRWATTEFEAMDTWLLPASCASTPPPRASRSLLSRAKTCHVCLLAGVMTCHSRVDRLPRLVQELVCGRCFEKLDAVVTISSRARGGNVQPSHPPDATSPAIFGPKGSSRF